MFYHNKKTYLNIREWVGKLNELYGQYGIKVQDRDVHQLFHHYGKEPIRTNSKREITPNGSIVWFSIESFDTMRYREDFLTVLGNICNYGSALGDGYLKTDKKKGKVDIIDANVEYKNSENDMKKHSEFLERQYNMENTVNKKKVIISESAFKRLFENSFEEGIEWKKGNQGNINLSINSKQNDYDNQGADTRIFGTKKNILYGDNTLGNHNKPLSNTVNDALLRKDQYQAIVNYAKNGFNGDLSSLTPSQLKKVKDKERENDVEGLLLWAEKSVDRTQNNIDANQYIVNKANNLVNDDDKMARYKKMKVKGTNVDVIALYVMNDFNFSDALKNGYMRQNPLTDTILGIQKNEREREQGLGKTSWKKIPVTYDNGQEFNLKSNFSLDLPQNYSNRDHFKQNFHTKEEYNSIKQFLDKSIIYAKYALNEEGFKPDYIVAAPSSSEFNKNYCINLSNKLGVPFVNDFFKRNLINVQFDEELLKQQPLSIEDEMALRGTVKKAMFGEIASEANVVVKNFIKRFWNYFNNINMEKSSRLKVEETLINDLLNDLLNDYLYKTLIMDSNENASNVYKTLINQVASYKSASKKYNNTFILNKVMDIIKKREVKPYFLQVIEKAQEILLMYTDKIENGFNINANKFKITNIQQRFRHYLNNVYVIADEALNKDKNLLTRYQNAKYLIFDEDINSGATLKLVIDALQEKTFGKQNNIMCLVNAYSASGY